MIYLFLRFKKADIKPGIKERIWLGLIIWSSRIRSSDVAGLGLECWWKTFKPENVQFAFITKNQIKTDRFRMECEFVPRETPYLLGQSITFVKPKPRASRILKVYRSRIRRVAPMRCTCCRLVKHVWGYRTCIASKLARPSRPLSRTNCTW
jgi:hypothetical protein